MVYQFIKLKFNFFARLVLYVLEEFVNYEKIAETERYDFYNYSYNFNLQLISDYIYISDHPSQHCFNVGQTPCFRTLFIYLLIYFQW